MKVIVLELSFISKIPISLFLTPFNLSHCDEHDFECFTLIFGWFSMFGMESILNLHFSTLRILLCAYIIGCKNVVTCCVDMSLSCFPYVFTLCFFIILVFWKVVHFFLAIFLWCINTHFITFSKFWLFLKMVVIWFTCYLGLLASL